MGLLDRNPLPEGEEDRLHNSRIRILAALQAGPQFNTTLARIAMKFDRRLRELRAMGYHIRSEHVEGGLWKYTLLSEPDPLYHVDIQSEFPDGHVWVHTVAVNANSIAKARNVAQHGQVITKILAVRKVDPTPPTPTWSTYEYWQKFDGR